MSKIEELRTQAAKYIAHAIDVETRGRMALGKAHRETAAKLDAQADALEAPRSLGELVDELGIGG